MDDGWVSEPSETAPEQLDPSGTLSRRALLAGLGVATVAGSGGTAWLLGARPGGQRQGKASAEPAWRSRRITLAQWQASRGDRYYIAHRGSGDVRPEHTIAAYDAAMGWGADAMEISTSSTSDGVLICMHDLTYDRTTTGSGEIHAQPSSVLERIGVRQPQLGPAWMRPPLPAVPRLQDVLQRYGARAVLCVEAKRDADYAAMIAMIEQHGLRESVIVKAFHTSNSIAAAQRSGYPVFAYLGATDTDAGTVGELANRLDRDRDYLVLPTTRRADGGALMNPDVVHSAVQTGVPVWVYPVHRRSEADYFFSLGVQGVIAASLGYAMSRVPRSTRDTWASGAIASGEMTRDPGLPSWQPQWAGASLTLAAAASQHFVTLGQFGPLAQAAASYQVEFDAKWDVVTSDGSDHLDLVFGHLDDQYYEDGLSAGNGYHAVIRANGSLELFSHRAGFAESSSIAPSASTPPAAAGQWMSFRLQVDPERITWNRTDGGAEGSVTATDSSFRGGYLHIGRVSAGQQSSVTFRNLRVR